MDPSDDLAALGRNLVETSIEQHDLLKNGPYADLEIETAEDQSKYYAGRGSAAK